MTKHLLVQVGEPSDSSADNVDSGQLVCKTTRILEAISVEFLRWEVLYSACFGTRGLRKGCISATREYHNCDDAITHDCIHICFGIDSATRPKRWLARKLWILDPNNDYNRCTSSCCDYTRYILYRWSQNSILASIDGGSFHVDCCHLLHSSDYILLVFSIPIHSGDNDSGSSIIATYLFSPHHWGPSNLARDSSS
ncbi:unnamed protein product [Phytophthora fragariaefolia]|uniref:Unnamed protein product n=1 Tax=Phytophthora fragariaefolia TaxID=1490495 RepID=A0A9W6Y2I9_9STRA|nr:unnamed protein product [Phytophthora fragariaefolia]